MNEVEEYLKKLLHHNDMVVIALSGGPDSMCLLNLLQKYDINIICAHINHNIRVESDAEAEMIKKYCAENNIVLECTKFEKKSDQDEYNEQELRTKRYQFLEAIVKKYDAKYLFTAHHGDDLIETILMRITRGSTLKGYCGFQKETRKDTYSIIRPFITITKDDIEKYNLDNGIKYVIDKSNFESKYTRNRYRHNVLPFLKKENQNIHSKYLKFSQELTKYYEHVSKEVEIELVSRYKNNKLNINNYHQLSPLLQEKIIENVLDIEYKNNINLINDQHIKLILSIINNKKPNLEISLPNDLKVTKQYNELRFSYDTKDNKEYLIELKDKAILPNNHQISIINNSEKTDNNYIRLNSKEIKLPLYIRTRKTGDKIIVKNMNGQQKIKDIFINCKLTKEEREQQPIVVDSEGTILWLPGLRKSKFDKAKTEFYDIILWYN